MKDQQGVRDAWVLLWYSTSTGTFRVLPGHYQSTAAVLVVCGRLAKPWPASLPTTTCGCTQDAMQVIRTEQLQASAAACVSNTCQGFERCVGLQLVLGCSCVC